MVLTYPVLIHEDSDGIWAEVPDFESCMTYADSVNEILDEVAEAIEGVSLVMLENGQALPKASDMKSFKNLPNDVFATLVKVDIDLAKNTKSVKKTLTIPEWLNERGLKMGVNFSQILQEALVAKTFA